MINELHSSLNYLIGLHSLFADSFVFFIAISITNNIIISKINNNNSNSDIDSIIKKIRQFYKGLLFGSLVVEHLSHVCAIKFYKTVDTVITHLQWVMPFTVTS